MADGVTNCTVWSNFVARFIPRGFINVKRCFSLRSTACFHHHMTYDDVKRYRATLQCLLVAM